MSNLEGVFPAIITPFTASGELDEAAFREVMEFNIQAGVHGFWVGGGTGESVLLDDDENQRLAAAAAEQAGGRVNPIMHVGAATTARAARLAEHAAKVGIETICCMPPLFYPVPDDEIVAHYRTVAAAADLPFMVYNLPQLTGVEITPALMARIKDAVPQLEGLKHSGPVMSDVRGFAKLDLACFIGNSHLMLPALTMGAVGCIDGPLNYAPELWLAIWEAYRAGDLAGAEAAQDRASEATHAVLEFGFPGSIKAALSERLGRECGDPRPPQPAVSAEQRKIIAARLEALGLGRVDSSAA